MVMVDRDVSCSKFDMQFEIASLHCVLKLKEPLMCQTQGHNLVLILNWSMIG